MAAATATALASLRYRERPSPGRGATLAVLAFLVAAVHPPPGATLGRTHPVGRASSAVAVAITAAPVLAHPPGVVELRRSAFMFDDPRSAGTYLMAEVRPGDAVVHSGSTARPLTRHYVPVATGRLDDALLAVAPVASGSITGREIPPDGRAVTVARVSRLWVIGTMSTSGWRSDDAVDDAAEGFTVGEHEDFGEWVVERWDRSGDLDQG